MQGFRGLGCRVLGVRILGFRGFRDSGFRTDGQNPGNYGGISCRTLFIKQTKPI